MDWQLVAVMVAVAAAALYVARGWWRSWSASKAGCSGGCGCGPKQDSPDTRTIISTDQLTARLRQRR